MPPKAPLTITVVHSAKHSPLRGPMGPPRTGELQKAYQYRALGILTPGLAPAADPECAAQGHDTRLGWAAIAGLVCCFPCGLVWLVRRDSVTCRRCGVEMPPQGIID